MLKDILAAEEGLIKLGRDIELLWFSSTTTSSKKQNNNNNKNNTENEEVQHTYAITRTAACPFAGHF